MTWPVLIPAAASLLCLEVGIAFAFIYAKVTRRRADLVFGLLAFGLAWVRWASLMRRVATGGMEGGLLWIRLEWAGGFLVLALFFHFVSATTEKPPLGRLGIPLVYAFAAALAGLTWTDWLLHLPDTPVDPADMEPLCRGLALNVLILLLLVGAMAGLVLILRRSPAQGTALSPLAQHRRHTFAAGMVLILAPGISDWAGHYVPATRGLSIQSLAAVIFCVIIARALGKEILRAEREKQRLAQLADFRSRAVRDVAHELKNPLAAIQMATQTVLDGAQNGIEPAAQCEVLEMCLDACRRLTRLINNMLDTARMEAGRELEVRAEETDLKALAETVLAFQQNTTLSHRLVLRSELGTRSVRLDADKVHQILSNLVHNAIKYSPDGGDVTVRLWQENGRVGISVTDGGIGMTPEQQTRLFEPFARVVDPERKITGTGIGLHLVRKLVTAQGGTVSVASCYGEGSTFTVMLPAEPPGGSVTTAVRSNTCVEEASAHG